MPKFEVQKVQEPKSFQSQHGTMYSVQMIGRLDGEIETVTLNVKAPENAPKVGETLDVTVEENQYGKKIKKVPSAQGNFGGGQSHHENPERQASIERQNSITGAINYCVAKANLLNAMGKQKEALEELTGKHVLEVATFIARYNAGKVTVTMTPEEIAAAFGYEQPTTNDTE